jgi:hypothetical protein
LYCLGWQYLDAASNSWQQCSALVTLQGWWQLLCTFRIHEKTTAQMSAKKQQIEPLYIYIHTYIISYLQLNTYMYIIYIHTPLHIPWYMHLNTIFCCVNLLKTWWFNHQQRGYVSPRGAPLWYPWGPQGPRLLPRKEEVGLGHVFHDPNGLRTPGRKGRNRWKGEMTNRFHHRNMVALWPKKFMVLKNGG